MSLSYSCELISNCIFTWGFTSFLKKSFATDWLWIDFKLYFYVRIHKINQPLNTLVIVVNWFQIVFLREDSQVRRLLQYLLIRCELISNCIFTWGFTSYKVNSFLSFWLWIDFKLYFYVRIHKRPFAITTESFVVNWFQIVFLREDSQVKIKNTYR